MKKSGKNKTVAELQDEYSQKVQTEHRKRFQEKYQILSDLFSQVQQRNNYKHPLTTVKPVPKIRFKKLQQIWKRFLSYFDYKKNHPGGTL